jgi:hypothetical protein
MIINPVPAKIPAKLLSDPEISNYFDQLNKSVYQIWHALNGNQNSVLISTTKGINAKNTGSTQLFKVPANKTFIPLFLVIRVVNFTAGSKSIQTVASFGGNSATYDDFLNSVTYTVVENNVCLFDKPDDATAVSVQAANDSFRIIIETASNATTEEWEIDLFGYLI